MSTEDCELDAAIDSGCTTLSLQIADVEKRIRDEEYGVEETLKAAHRAQEELKEAEHVVAEEHAVVCKLEAQGAAARAEASAALLRAAVLKRRKLRVDSNVLVATGHVVRAARQRQVEASYVNNYITTRKRALDAETKASKLLPEIVALNRAATESDIAEKKLRHAEAQVERAKNSGISLQSCQQLQSSISAERRVVAQLHNDIASAEAELKCWTERVACIRDHIDAEAAAAIEQLVLMDSMRVQIQSAIQIVEDRIRAAEEQSAQHQKQLSHLNAQIAALRGRAKRRRRSNA